MPARVRPAAVAGTFYPRRSPELRSMIDELLAERQDDSRPGAVADAYVVPHAGYVYSGHVAAYAYRRIADHRPPRVLLLGPTHRVACRGLALPGCDAFATPLGEVEVDRALVAAVQGMAHVATRADVHADEHALEVQLPFLQTCAPGVPVLPVCVGDASPAEVATVVDAVLATDPETLVLVSSDLSHFHPDARARALDAETILQVLALDGTIHHRRACGAAPLNGLLVAATRRGWRPELLATATSADTIGDPGRVVGYAAFSFEGGHGAAG